MHSVPWKARCCHAHFLLQLNPNLQIYQIYPEMNWDFRALPQWFLRWDGSFLFQRFCGWWVMYFCWPFYSSLCFTVFWHTYKKWCWEIPQQINCESCLWISCRHCRRKKVHAWGRTHLVAWTLKAVTSQTKETRIPRCRCHGWVLKSWVKTYSGVFLIQCLLLMQNTVLRNMYTRKGISHLRGIRSPAIPPPTCPCCPVGGASSHSGQEFNNIKMSILRCHQQGRRLVVGLLHQLGFFVWPVSLQELQRRDCQDDAEFSSKISWLRELLCVLFWQICDEILTRMIVVKSLKNAEIYSANGCCSLCQLVPRALALNVQKEAHNCHMTVLCSNEEGWCTATWLLPGVGTFLLQVFHNVKVAVLSCNIQWTCSILQAHVYQGYVGSNQVLDNLQVPILCCNK